MKETLFYRLVDKGSKLNSAHTRSTIRFLRPRPPDIMFYFSNLYCKLYLLIYLKTFMIDKQFYLSNQDSKFI